MMGSGQQRLIEVLQKAHGIEAPHGRETVQKGLQRLAVEDVVDQGLHGNTGPKEDRGAA